MSAIHVKIRPTPTALPETAGGIDGHARSRLGRGAGGVTALLEDSPTGRAPPAPRSVESQPRHMTDGSVTVTIGGRRSPTENRCAYCHDPIGTAVAAFCPLCETRLHHDCVTQLRRCPTIGCTAEFDKPGAEAPPAPAPLDGEPQGLSAEPVPGSDRSLVRFPTVRTRGGRNTDRTLGTILARRPVVLEDCDLRGLNLANQELDDAVFAGSDLEEARLERTSMRRVDLRRAQLVRANIGYSKLTSANLEGANLERAILTESDLTGADLTRTNLRNADLDRTNLTRAKVGQARLDGARLGKACLLEATFDASNLSGANLSQANLERARLVRALCGQADVSGANMKGADLTSAVLRGSDARGLILRQAKAPGIDLRGADLRHADLSGSNLAGADLEGARLDGAILVKTDLTSARLHGASLRDAKLEGVVLTEAVYDKKTVWPKRGFFRRFDPRSRGAIRE